MRKGEPHLLFNCTVETGTGQTLRSCRIWLRDSEDQIYGTFSINLDVTLIIMRRDVIGGLARDGLQLHEGESYMQIFDDLHQMLDTMMTEAEHRIGTSAEDMDKGQRIELVRFLDERGAFQVSNSAPIAASPLGVMRETIYSCPSGVARDRQEAPSSR